MLESEISIDSTQEMGGGDTSIAKGGVACPFPWRLHEMLEAAAEEGFEDIVSWAQHGRSFTVHQPKEFAGGIMKRFFSHSKYPSFQRQLNLYGFSRFTKGKDKGAYYHLCFVRGHRNLVRNMIRKKIKGTKGLRKTLGQQEPDFYHSAWNNHFEASVPPALATRIVSPVGIKAVLPPLPTTTLKRAVRMVDRIPHVVEDKPLTLQQLAGGIVSESEKSSSWDSPPILNEDPWQRFEFTQTVAKEVIIPPAVLENTPIYEDPFEPTPIREPLLLPRYLQGNVLFDF